MVLYRQWKPSYIWNPPHSYVGSHSRAGCHLNRTPRSYLRKIILKETCLFFRQVWTLCWRSVYWIKSLSAQSYPDHWLPSNPASQKAIPRAFVQTHTCGARLREAEKHLRLHPKWLQISCSDTLHLLLTQLLINNLKAFTPHIIMCCSIHDASSLVYKWWY